jgi:iron(III) transport system ATP-binding protein
MSIAAMQPVLITLTGISKGFAHGVKGQIFAVNDVSLTVVPGELLTLLGPSGCGKTTTLRMIAGFEQPSSGSIHIGERDVTSLRANERNIGFVFQNYAIFPHLSVFENVAYGLRVQNQSDDEIKRAVHEVLELVGLGGYAQQQPHQLSGGEQQRVALARAIVFKPRILLFDEPLSNLDAQLRVQMRSEIQQLQKRLGITTVYVTHDQEEAMAISDRIAVMSGGKIVQIDVAEDLYDHPHNEFVARFIGRANLLDGKLIDVEAGKVAVDVLGQTVIVSGAPVGSKAGDVVRVMIRPERIAIARGGSHNATGTAGTTGIVASRTFLGEKTEYHVAVGEHSIQATVFGQSRALAFAPGDAVQVICPAQNIHLIRL